MSSVENLRPRSFFLLALSSNSDCHELPTSCQKARVNGAPFTAAREVCIVGVARTPCGSLQGKLSALKASDLAGVAIKGNYRAGVKPNDVEELILGHVISAGAGQAPAKQAAVSAGLPQSVVCSTVNKVCASGMKAMILGAQSIMLGLRDVVVVGGMESMSQAPHLSKKARSGARYGDLVFSDALQTSYRRALEATKSGKFIREVVEVQVPPAQRGAAPQTVTEDEEVVMRPVDVASLSKLRPCFKPSGDFGPTVTAGNASPISDGAAALVLMSLAKANTLGLSSKIQAIVRGFGEAEQEPRSFTTSPALAIPKALEMAGVEQDDVDFFEINEAFSVVACANTKLLKLDPAKVNVYGGAVAIGHPLGCSGARIIVTLCSVLHQECGQIGCAAVCNGGGGASALVIEKVYT
ncbi:Thiolase, C-terminal [Phytophthora cactorum]|nr:Thiolase, C-terminal [Phytophthora cactorum]